MLIKFKIWSKLKLPNWVKRSHRISTKSKKGSQIRKLSLKFGRIQAKKQCLVLRLWLRKSQRKNNQYQRLKLQMFKKSTIQRCQEWSMLLSRECQMSKNISVKCNMKPKLHLRRAKKNFRSWKSKMQKFWKNLMTRPVYSTKFQKPLSNIIKIRLLSDIVS